MHPTHEKVSRLMKALRLDAPIIAVYDSAPKSEFEPYVTATGRTCCFAYFKQWMKGTTVAVSRGGGGFGDPKNGCYGMQTAFGLEKSYPSFMANFLTDGKGAPMGEGLKATPELAQEFLDRARPPAPSGDSVLVGPLRLDQWDKVKSLTFFADPDRLAALMTLAAYWSSDPDFIFAPFSSGCGLMLRELANQDHERAIIGCTDIAMRKYLPPDILCLSVLPPHFTRMVDFPEEAFLNRDWWAELMRIRGKGGV